MTKPWTHEELKLARRMRDEEFSYTTIADFLGRTKGAVVSKLDRSNGRRRQRKRGLVPEFERHPWHPARDPIPARYDWFHGYGREQTAV